MSSAGYNGNNNLPKAFTKHSWTPHMVSEYIKCKNDPIYFAETYFKIIHVDKGVIPFKLYEYQKEAIVASATNRKFIMNASRQCGKCVSINTEINIRNKTSNEIVKVSVRDFMMLTLKNSGFMEKINSDEELIVAYSVYAKFIKGNMS